MRAYPKDSFLLQEKQLKMIKQVLDYIYQGQGIRTIPQVREICDKSISRIPILDLLFRIFKHILQHTHTLKTEQRTLTVVSMLFQTCEPYIILLIQVFILPFITRTIEQSFLINHEKTKQFDREPYQFITEQLSIKSLQYLILWAEVKSKRLFENLEINEISLFQQAINTAGSFMNSNQKNIQPKQLCSILRISYRNIKVKIDELRQKFLKRLTAMERGDVQNIQLFSQFYQIKFIEQKRKKKNNKRSNQNQILQIYTNWQQLSIQDIPFLQCKQLFKSLDFYLTSPMLRNCMEILKIPDTFEDKEICLEIITDFIQWGDIEAYLVVSYSDIFKEIGHKISQVKGHLGLNEGKNIYPQLKDAGQKIKFYLSFLRLLEIFYFCKIEQDDENLGNVEIRLIYERLKYSKNFIFPENMILQKIKKDFLQQIQKNIIRNHCVLNKINFNPENQISFDSSLLQSSLQQTRQRNFIKKVKYLVNRKQQLLICEELQKITLIIKELDIFENQLDQQLQNISENQSINPQYYQSIVEGQKIVETSHKLKMYLKEYENGSINLQNLKSKITDIIEIRSEIDEQLFHLERSYSSLQIMTVNDQPFSINKIQSDLVVEECSLVSENEQLQSEINGYKPISNRIRMIFERMQGIDLKQSLQISQEIDQINMSLSPSINSEVSESIIEFHECLNLKKQLIRENIFAKTFFKYSGTSEIEQTLKQKTENLTTKESDSYRSQISLFKRESNAGEFKINQQSARLINMNSYDQLFHKINRQIDKQTILNRNLHLYQDQNLKIKIQLVLIDNEIKFKMYLAIVNFITSISFEEIASQLQTIKVQFSVSSFTKLKQKSSHCLKGNIKMLNYQQTNFPTIMCKYYQGGCINKFTFQIPINIHHFTQYQPISAFNEKPGKMNILRTQIFKIEDQLLNNIELQKLIQGLKILDETRKQKLFGVEGYLAFTKAKFRLYLNLMLTHLQIFGVTESKRTQPLEYLISTLRYSFGERS